MGRSVTARFVFFLTHLIFRGRLALDAAAPKRETELDYSARQCRQPGSGANA